MKINPETKLAYTLMHQGTLALARAEQQGLRVDLEYLAAEKPRLEKRIKRLEKKFRPNQMFR